MEAVNKVAYALVVGANVDSSTTTTATTTLSLEDRYLELRKNKTTKDADLVIKMSADFIKDMQQKMLILKRIARNYDASADYMVGASYNDLQRRFKHMCDLYKEFATVRRYVFGKELNDTAPNWDVVVVYQIMLSDYNEILMLMELLKVEQRYWAESAAEDASRDLIKKQMAKFGNLPEKLTPPSIKETDDKEKLIGEQPAQGAERRRWVRGSADYPHYPQKWSGELDGVGFDNR